MASSPRIYYFSVDRTLYVHRYFWTPGLPMPSVQILFILSKINDFCYFVCLLYFYYNHTFMLQEVLQFPEAGGYGLIFPAFPDFSCLFRRKNCFYVIGKNKFFHTFACNKNHSLCRFSSKTAMVFFITA